MENIDEVYELFKSSKKSLEILFKQYLDNPNNSLEDKWNKLITVGRDLELTDCGYFTPFGIDWSKHTLYDDFYIDRDVTYNILDLYIISKERGFLDNEEAFKIDCIKEGNFYYRNSW